MQSKLGLICDRIIEAGWLAAALYTPIYFNVYSSRVFEPDKISMLRNIVLMMTIAWFIKLIEGALAARANPRRAGEAEGGLWSRIPDLLRVPLMIPVILYAAIYLFTTLTSVVPLTAFFGSYQRLQGTISQYSYIMLFLMIVANMRSRAQLERLITFCIVTSVPVAVYGLLQASGHDPLPWAGDVQTRVASTLGNAIFVAAYLIMVVPLTLMRLVGAVARWRSRGAEPEAAPESNDDPWSLAVIGSGAIFLLMIVQYAGVVTGNRIEGQGTPYNSIADFLMWGLVLVVAGLFAWAANNVAGRNLRPGARYEADEESGPSPAVQALLPLAQCLVFLLGIYIIGSPNFRVSDFSLWIVLPGALFIVYALTFLYTVSGRTSDLGVRLQLVGLPLLLVAQILVIFLTQSRGPELGLLIGLGVFAFAFLLRRRLYRAFGVTLAVALLFGAFLLVFNLPNSPIESWRSLPYIGRLGLLTQTDEGTGKVRTLIWQGATNLILSDPIRTVIGWGPESMYVAYNKFYPPELGHWELRNATPDRSHDVFFDQTVTMGLLGLAGYLFLMGAFVWYAVKALRRATSLRDQLILIGLLSMTLAHLGELVTGIQIAATYTYFYIAAACLVVLGYVLTDYLRPAAAPVTEAALDGAAALEPAAELVAANGHEAGVGAAPARGGVAVGQRAGTRTATAVTATRRAAPTAAAGGPRRPGAPPASGRTIAPAPRSAGGARPNTRSMGAVGSFAARQPSFLLGYAGLLIFGLLIAIGLNVNLVKADMFYKQGLAYDSNQQWPGAIGPYDKAIAISPNEDFYYLFLGRAYMEWSKNPKAFPGSPPATQLLAQAESELIKAQGLNPRNTDHYANLARLYVWWADAMSDPNSGVPGTAQDQAQRYAAGIAQYEKAHDLSPGNASIWNELALAYAKAGRYDDAEAAIRGSQKMDDGYAQTPFIAAEIERSRAEQLTGLAQQAGVTKELSATYTLSATQVAQTAAADYATAVKLSPSQLQDDRFDQRIAFLQAHNALPVLATAYRSVISDALAAKQRDPNSPDEPVQARAALGYIETKLGQQADAIKQFERAVALQCDDFYNLQNLGMLYRDSGDDEKALNMMQAALAVADCNPSDPYVNACAPLKKSTQSATCTPLTGQDSAAAAVNSLRTEVQRLKQKLGRP